MTGKDLERSLASLTPASAAFLDHTGRALRAAGLMPLGGRGVQAPAITAQHAANMLLGTALADAPPQAPGLVTTYSALPASWSGHLRTGKPDEIKPFVACETLGEALAAILSNVALAFEVSEIRINRSWPHAVIVAKNPEHTGYYGFASYEDAKQVGFRTSPCALVFHVPTGSLQHLANDLANNDDRAEIWD